jgi:hypothetical protein
LILFTIEGFVSLVTLGLVVFYLFKLGSFLINLLRRSKNEK